MFKSGRNQHLTTGSGTNPKHDLNCIDGQYIKRNVSLIRVIFNKCRSLDTKRKRKFKTKKSFLPPSSRAAPEKIQDRSVFCRPKQLFSYINKIFVMFISRLIYLGK